MKRPLGMLSPYVHIARKYIQRAKTARVVRLYVPEEKNTHKRLALNILYCKDVKIVSNKQTSI